MWIRLSTSWFTLLLMASCVLAEQKNSQRSVFMEWTSWTVCSKTCNQGIQMRTRDCANTSKNCNQTEKQLKVCQQQECKGKVRDSRDLQCQHFSSKVVHGRRHHWFGYTHERNQCELYCKASYYGFYMKFGDKVEDGTTCKDSGSDGICVNGRCQLSCLSLGELDSIIQKEAYKSIESSQLYVSVCCPTAEPENTKF